MSEETMQNKTDNQDEVLLRVEHLSQHFGRLKAVDDVSFEIHRGEVFGLVGESGCGKTTTGRTIIKLYKATGGNVYFKGQRICAGTLTYKEEIRRAIAERDKKRKALKAELKGADSAEEKARINREIAEADAVCRKIVSAQKEEIRLANSDQNRGDKKFAARHAAALTEEYRAKMDAEADPDKKAALRREFREKLRIVKHTKLITQIQMIFQDPIASLDPRMTVREIISEGLMIQGIRDRKYIDEQVYRMLETVGLVREHAGRYPHEFSGGQRQRIGVARSIVMNPELIIADEPISALDVSIRAQVINLLNELRQKFGLTIMFIAHDLSVVKYFSDRIGVMYYGKMVELASSDELFRHPFHPYTRSLLSAIPQPDPHYEKKRKRIVYDPLTAHDYSVQQPTFREVLPGHFVRCNDQEFAEMRRTLEKESQEQ